MVCAGAWQQFHVQRRIVVHHDGLGRAVLGGKLGARARIAQRQGEGAVKVAHRVGFDRQGNELAGFAHGKGNRATGAVGVAVRRTRIELVIGQSVGAASRNRPIHRCGDGGIKAADRKAVHRVSAVGQVALQLGRAVGHHRQLIDVVVHDGEHFLRRIGVDG